MTETENRPTVSLIQNLKTEAGPWKNIFGKARRQLYTYRRDIPYYMNRRNMLKSGSNSGFLFAIFYNSGRTSFLRA
jgi:hypothetical protein